MRIRIASILLGEDVTTILEKIKTYLIESENLKSQLDSLLKKKLVLRNQISKGNNRHTSIINQIDVVKDEIKQKRACCDLLNEIEKIEKDISNKESIKSACLSEIGDKRNLLSVTTSKTNDLRRDISIANQDIEKNERKVHSLLEPSEKEEVEKVDKEINEYKEWLKSHLIDLTQIDQEADEIIKLLDDRNTFIEFVKSLIEIDNSLIQFVIRKEQLSTDIDDMKNNYHDLITTKDKIKIDIANTNEDITNKEKVFSDNNEANSELQIINKGIEEIQEWLRNHSGELTRLQSEVDARIFTKEHENPPQQGVIPSNPKRPERIPEGKEQLSVDRKTKVHKAGLVDGPRKKRNRIIKEIYDLETGETIIADDFFQKPMNELSKARDLFQECIAKNVRRFVCPKCFEMIRISGRGDERGVPSIFTHKNDSVYCDRTTTGRSIKEIERIKYGRFGQSQRHKDLKESLYNCLRDTNSILLGVKNVEIEKRVKSTIPFFNYRQPDVLIEYQGKKIVFEIQLSTTFLSVIKERNTFYRLNGYYIIWVFNFDDNRRYVDLNNLAMKDIYFANKMNAFIFDDEAREWSKQRKQLVLKCNWLDTDIRWHYPNTEDRFGGVPITLDQLTFDADTYKPYYYDAETPYYESHPEIVNKYTEEQKSIEDYIKDLENEKQKKELRIKEAQELMMERNDSVVPFLENNKWGFKYGVTIIEPQFTSYEKIENGSFIVKYNRHCGLIDKNGNYLFKCNYLNIHRLANDIIIAESTSGFYISDKEKISDRSPHDTITLEALSNELSVFVLNSKKLDVYIICGDILFKKFLNFYAFYTLFGVKIGSDEYSKYHFTDDYLALWLKDIKTGMWKITEIDGTDKNDKEYSDCVFESNLVIATKTGASDIYTTQGELLKSTDYDEINVHNDYILAKKNGKWALFDVHCTKLSEFEYDYISDFKSWDSSWSNWILVERDNLKGLYNSEGHCVLKALFESIESCNYLLLVKQEDKYGLYDKEGNPLLEPIYDSIKTLRNNNNLIAIIGEKHFIYCIIGNYIDGKAYDSISALDDNYLIVELGGMYGLSTTHGEICIPINNQEIERFKLYVNFKNCYNESIFKCRFNDRVGAYSVVERKFVVKAEYDDVEWVNGLLFKVNKDSKWGLYEIGKGLLTKIKYHSISDYKDSRISVSISDDEGVRTGHITPEGKEICSNSIILPNGYETKEFFSKWGLFKDSESIISYMYDSPIESTDHGLFKVKVGDKYGIINIQNRYVFQPQYSDVIFKEDFSFAIVKQIKYRKEREYTWGSPYHMIDVEYNEYQLFNIDGTQTGIPSNFCQPFTKMSFGDTGYVWIDNHILSLEKFVMTDDTYTSFESFDDNGYILVKQGKLGLLNSNLEKVLSCDFDSINKWGNNLLLTKRDYWINYATKEEEYALFKLDGTLCPIGTFSCVPIIDDERKAKVHKNGLEGYIDLDGNIIPSSSTVLNNELVVKECFGYIEVLDIESNILIYLNEKIKSIEPFTIGIYKIKDEKNKSGLFSFAERKIVVLCNYDSIEPWSNDIAVGYLSSITYPNPYNTFGIYKLISINGSPINQNDYYQIDKLENGRAQAIRLGLSGWLDEKGNEIIDTKESLTDELSKIRKFSLWGVEKDRVIIPCQYSEITMFDGDNILAKSPNNTYHLYGLDGSLRLNYAFSRIYSMDDGFFVVKTNYCALMNSECKDIIPFSENCLSIKKWSQNLYLAKKERRYSYSTAVTYYSLYNRKGECVTNNEFTQIGELEDGKALVSIGNRTGYIDENGNGVLRNVDNRGEWTVKECLGIYSIYKGNLPIFSNLRWAKFLNDNLIRIKQNDFLQLYRIGDEKLLNEKYKGIGNFKDDKAEAEDINGLKGFIDYDGNRINEVVTKGEWSIRKGFEPCKITKNDITKLDKLQEAYFFSDDIIIIKQNNSKVYKLYSLIDERITEPRYKTIGELYDGKAEAINDNGVKGYLDCHGKEIYDEVKYISESIKAYGSFSKYTLKDGEKTLLSDLYEISSWSDNSVLIKKANNDYQLFDINSQKYVGETFQSVGELKDGKAQITKDDKKGFIDINGNLIPEEEIILGQNLRKIKKLGFWYIVDDNYHQIINESFVEIGSYKRKFVKFEYGDFRLLNIKANAVVPLYGTYYKNCPYTLIYKVGGFYVRIQKKLLDLKEKSISDFIKENNTLKIVISYINLKKQSVFAKPYKGIPSKVVTPPYEMGQVVEGTIIQVISFGIRIKTKDGRKTLIHISRLQELGYGDYTFKIAQSIIIKKVGFDESHNNDIWEIISIDT